MEATAVGTSDAVPALQHDMLEDPQIMLQLLLILIVIALVAGAMGFTTLAGAAATLAKIVAGIMLVGIVIILILAAMGLAILF